MRKRGDAHVVQGGAFVLAQIETYFRMQALVGNHGRGDQRGGRQHVQAYLYRVVARHGAQFLREPADFFVEGLHARMEILAVFRKLDVAPLRPEKRHPDFFFELVDGLGERRLHDAQVVRTLRHVLRAGDFQKVLKMRQFHVRALNP